MLISHSHRFIFVKTKKSAGTSVEISLSRFCDGPHDVVTPVLPHGRKFQEAVGVRAKNYQGDKKRYQGHASTAWIRALVGESTWNAYVTFCVVRNPWSRVVSQYHFRRVQQGLSLSFDQFVREERFTVEHPLYCRDGELLVDHVLRFEHRETDMRRITQRLGLDWDGWLPQANSGFSSPGQHYSKAC